MLQFIHMIESAALVTLAILALSFLGPRLDRSHWLKGGVTGLIFGLTGLLSMAAPIVLAPGIVVDARNVVMALSAGLGGPISTVVTGAMLVAMRVWFGGAGMVAGIFAILVVGAGSTVVWFVINRRYQGQLNIGGLFALAAIAAATPALLLVFIPNLSADMAFSLLSLLVPTNFVAVIVLGLLFLGDLQRRWAIAAYGESRLLLQAMVNNAPGVLFQLKEERPGSASFTYVSAGVKRFLGIGVEELLANSSHIDRLFSPNDLARAREKLATSASSMQSWVMEAELAVRGGGKVWVRIAAKPRMDPSGKVIWDGSLFDITDRKRMEQMKNDFISTVSHELRTPLTSIRGSLGLVAGGAAGELPKKAASLINIAHSNSERLVRLINDILDIEKIESGRMPFEPIPVGLHPAVEQAVEASRDYLADRNVEISVVDDAPDANVYVDPDRLHQVLTNLLSNAIKYSPEDGTVVVNLCRKGDNLRISVIDNGPGIPEAFRSRIFRRFEQADSSATRQKGGTGLGLNIAKAIVERSGGDISFESEPDVRTVFHVDLPEWHVTREASPAVEMSLPAETSRTVLICEDAEDVAELIAENLQQEGFQSTIARNVAAARRDIAAKDYLAVIVDLDLENEAGLSLIRELCDATADRGMPVIMISASIDDAQRVLNGSAVGVAAWLERPRNMEELRRAASVIAARLSHRRPSILHVEDDDSLLEVMAAELGEEMQVVKARTIAEAKAALSRTTFDLVILDLGLPDGQGACLLGTIPSGTAVIIFSAADAEKDVAKRVQAAMTKTRTSEKAIADLVRKLAFEHREKEGAAQRREMGAVR
ncbi:PAS domain S-box-containing protein [Rhodopseudomonas julia]|uniref:histidine kinase n=1 Tax=Rhodopseudomonas julia TaxID=200617 RepID=A0ABU0C8H3_9BRAD|nr:ATP-binding protein [Rhodopseudomonas julia]MDQ0326522.1 PAS domain S-box-containing protein [Rhodopseudomonas julia]